MNKDEYRERIAAAMARGAARQDGMHPSTPMMPEDTRELSEAFGSLFNMWPPKDRGAKQEKVRRWWAEGLRDNTHTWDGEPIDPVPYWRTIRDTGKQDVYSPHSTIKAVRMMHAAAPRKFTAGDGFKQVRAPDDWRP